MLSQDTVSLCIEALAEKCGKYKMLGKEYNDKASTIVDRVTNFDEWFAYSKESTMYAGKVLDIITAIAELKRL